MDDTMKLDSWYEAARTHHKAGRLQEAERGYRRILREVPEHAATLNLLGALLESQGDSAESAKLLRRAVQLRPEAASFHNNLGNALRSLGAHADAQSAYREALRLRPEYPRAHYNLGALLQGVGRLDEAATCFEAALALDPTLGAAALALADVRCGQQRFAEAEAIYRALVERDPNHADAHFALGNLLRQQGRTDAAVACFQRCVRLRPDFGAAYNNLGSLHQIRGAVGAAIACLQRALEIEPDSAEAHYNLGTLLEGERQLEGARAEYEAALARGGPTAPQLHVQLAHVNRLLCDWADADSEPRELVQQIEAHLRSASGRGLPPLTLNLFQIPAALRLAVARRQARGLDQATAEARARCAFTFPNEEPERLRIGYVSPDFRGHAVGTLVHRLFEHHDREAFEVYAYSLVDVDDAQSRSIRAGCDHFVDASRQSPEETARRIHADGIHVLIDLAGYTTYSRTAIFALRPAPVQAHYLGYLDTMGAKFLPYLISDAICVPDELAAGYSEAVVTLPDCCFPASPLPISEAPLQRSEFGLPEDGVVFCCMNSLHKLDPGTFDVWMRVLTRVPDSVLWLFESTTETGVENLRREARERGVAPERLVFAGKLPLPEYLARYRLADLFLDTFAYNAGATAIGALRAGLPVLTLPGDTYFARMGASICTAAGLEDLVCDSPEQYEERAVELGGDREALAELRQRLVTAPDAAPLFDTARSARNLERAYRMMWRDHADGVAPRPLRVPAAE